MKEYLNQKVLITTQNWFYAPDGKQYRGVWGTLKGVHDPKEVYGFTPNRNHANWIIEIGEMAVMGCQVMYCIKCPSQPPTRPTVQRLREHEMDSKVLMIEVETEIYFTT